MYSHVVDHLGLPMGSATGRKLQPQFRAMEAAGLVYCKTEGRAIIRLPRTEPLDHELKASHSSYEGVRRYDRNAISSVLTILVRGLARSALAPAACARPLLVS